MVHGNKLKVRLKIILKVIYASLLRNDAYDVLRELPN